MTTDMVVGGMMGGAEVVKKGDDADAFIGKACVHGFHLSEDSEGVLGKSTTKTVMGVATCCEVGAIAEVGKDAVCAWTADFTEEGDDLFFNVFHNLFFYHCKGTKIIRGANRNYTYNKRYSVTGVTGDFEI